MLLTQEGSFKFNKVDERMPTLALVLSMASMSSHSSYWTDRKMEPPQSSLRSPRFYI